MARVDRKAVSVTFFREGGPAEHQVAEAAADFILKQIRPYTAAGAAAQKKYHRFPDNYERQLPEAGISFFVISAQHQKNLGIHVSDWPSLPGPDDAAKRLNLTYSQ